jgi:hypothetical protein
LIIHHLSVFIKDLSFSSVDPLWPPFVRYFPNSEATVCTCCEENVFLAVIAKHAYFFSKIRV